MCLCESDLHSHNTKPTLSKCTTQGTCRTFARSCNDHLSLCPEHVHPLRRRPRPRERPLRMPSTAAGDRKSALCLCICWFFTFSINGTMQDLSLCVCVLHGASGLPDPSTGQQASELPSLSRPSHIPAGRWTTSCLSVPMLGTRPSGRDGLMSPHVQRVCGHQFRPTDHEFAVLTPLCTCHEPTETPPSPPFVDSVRAGGP